MAKVIKKIVRSEEFKMTKHELKKGGLCYEITESKRFGSAGVAVLIGYTLKECTDGWYQVFDSLGDKCCFCIGAVALDDIAGKKIHN